MKRLVGAMLLACATVLPGAGVAQDFYQGKTLTYIVSTSPGGGYDTYARLIAKYLEKHLGAQVQVKNLPGAGHIIGANTLYASAPDGLTIGTFNTGLIYAQILSQAGVDFDLRQMEWIGKASSDPRAVLVSEGSGLATVEDLKNAEGLKFAAAGVGSAAYTDTKLISSALDLDIEIIPGFNGNEGELAMMRGEVQGQVGSMSSLQSFVDNGNGAFVLAIGGDGTVPEAIDYAETDAAKSIVSVVQALSSLGRLTAAPPGTPEERVADLRAGYEAALTDPDLLAEAAKLDIPIDPAYGEEVEALILAALNQSPETVAIIAEAVEVEVPTITVTSDILKLEDENKMVTFMSGDAEVTAAISGSRTKLTINGAEAERSQLTVGMACTIEYDPSHEENEPKVMECNG